MKLLIDTEVYLYKAAAASEHEAEWAPDDWTYLCRHGDAKAYFQESIGALIEVAPTHQPVLVFSSGASFRYGIWPAYKANRKNYRKPAGYRQLVEWVEQVSPTRGWEIVRLPDVEGDDVLGILQEEGDIIASTDKDMLTLPGWHLRNGELVEVSELEANRNFYSQALTGDTADNYPGCPGIGPVAAERLLAGCSTELEMWQAVVAAYAKKDFDERYAINQARCARILRRDEYNMRVNTPLLWSPPVA